MPEKRPHPDGDTSYNDSKRTRSNNASPAPPSHGTATVPAKQRQIAEARAKAAAVVARLAAAKQGTGSQASSAPPARSAVEASRARIEAMKARVAAATGSKSTALQPKPVTAPPSVQFPELDDGPSRAKGGLGIGLHPALMGDLGQDRNKKKQPTPAATHKRNEPAQKERKQLDLSGPSVEELKKNPFFDNSFGSQPINNRSRLSRQLIFHQKGKFIQQANALRRQAGLEAMKKRIAEQSRKIGLDEDNERSFLVPPPPDIEWWDEGLVDGKNYSDPSKYLIDTPDSIITIYVQHPVLIEPPQDKRAPAPKPMYLTKTERAKLRRQRRMADHKEQQAKIRLGFEPPPPPKVKKSNLMRVLGEQAVKDPTAVEALVTRQIAEREAVHERDNEARKLTKEQQHEKLAANQDADAAKGIHMAVFKIDNLSYGKHRYQIDINAKQDALTGICILNPKFNLVIVEGGAHSIAHYKKLMLNRIRWSENAAPSSVREGNREAEAAWLQTLDERGELKDLSLNKCTLIWEGEERARAFRKWGSRVCETDGEAKDALSRAKMENFWTLAKTTA